MTRILLEDSGLAEPGRHSGEARARGGGLGCTQSRASARGGGGGNAGRACRATGAPVGRRLPWRRLRAAAATPTAAADSHGGSARPGPPPLSPASG